ncbi:MAG: GntR family transcriptional regulator [Thiothrix sp.]|nr:MAG: GntR family transcriptional regulator [Thiothrix sp.]
MKKENLYSDLKRQILTMELEPGASLDETTLSEEYQISRTPLRDVFRRLAGEGYLEIVSNRGASVASMNHKTLRNFFLTAPMLYAAVGRLAAMNATPKQIDSMRAAQREFRNAALRQDSESLIYWNDRFHTLMGEMAANPYLRPSYERLLIDHARISQTFYRPRDPHMTENMQQALDQHDAMIECIANGQADAMVELIREHWELSRSHMETYVHPDPLPIE